jgi:hypothetical protein
MQEDLFNTNTDLEIDITPRNYFDQNLEKKIEKLRADADAQRKRTWQFYQQLKNDNPSKYWSPKIQAQMHRDADALGDGFTDGDFNG